MQKLVDQRKAAPLLDCGKAGAEHGHILGHTF